MTVDTHSLIHREITVEYLCLLIHREIRLVEINLFKQDRLNDKCIQSSVCGVDLDLLLCALPSTWSTMHSSFPLRSYDRESQLNYTTLQL